MGTKELQAGVQIETCIQNFITLVILVEIKTQKSTKEWINKCSIYLYNEVFTTKRNSPDISYNMANLENTRLSEICQTQTDTYCMIPFTQIGKSICVDCGCQELEERDSRERLLSESAASIWNDGKSSEISSDDYTTS